MVLASDYYAKAINNNLNNLQNSNNIYYQNVQLVQPDEYTQIFRKAYLEKPNIYAEAKAQAQSIAGSELSYYKTQSYSSSWDGGYYSSSSVSSKQVHEVLNPFYLHVGEIAVPVIFKSYNRLNSSYSSNGYYYNNFLENYDYSVSLLIFSADNSGIKYKGVKHISIPSNATVVDVTGVLGIGPRALYLNIFEGSNPELNAALYSAYKVLNEGYKFSSEEQVKQTVNTIVSGLSNAKINYPFFEDLMKIIAFARGEQYMRIENTSYGGTSYSRTDYTEISNTLGNFKIIPQYGIDASGNLIVVGTYQATYHFHAYGTYRSDTTATEYNHDILQKRYYMMEFRADLLNAKLISETKFLGDQILSQYSNYQSININQVQGFLKSVLGQEVFITSSKYNRSTDSWSIAYSTYYGSGIATVNLQNLALGQLGTAIYYQSGLLVDGKPAVDLYANETILTYNGKIYGSLRGVSALEGYQSYIQSELGKSVYGAYASFIAEAVGTTSVYARDSYIRLNMDPLGNASYSIKNIALNTEIYGGVSDNKIYVYGIKYTGKEATAPYIYNVLSFSSNAVGKVASEAFMGTTALAGYYMKGLYSDVSVSLADNQVRVSGNIIIDNKAYPIQSLISNEGAYFKGLGVYMKASDNYIQAVVTDTQLFTKYNPYSSLLEGIKSLGYFIYGDAISDATPRSFIIQNKNGEMHIGQALASNNKNIYVSATLSNDLLTVYGNYANVSYDLSNNRISIQVSNDKEFYSSGFGSYIANYIREGLIEQLVNQYESIYGPAKTTQIGNKLIIHRAEPYMKQIGIDTYAYTFMPLEVSLPSIDQLPKEYILQTEKGGGLSFVNLKLDINARYNPIYEQILFLAYNPELSKAPASSYSGVYANGIAYVIMPDIKQIDELASQYAKFEQIRKSYPSFSDLKKELYLSEHLNSLNSLVNKSTTLIYSPEPKTIDVVEPAHKSPEANSIPIFGDLYKSLLNKSTTLIYNQEPKTIDIKPTDNSVIYGTIEAFKPVEPAYRSLEVVSIPIFDDLYKNLLNKGTTLIYNPEPKIIDVKPTDNSVSSIVSSAFANAIPNNQPILQKIDLPNLPSYKLDSAKEAYNIYLQQFEIYASTHPQAISLLNEKVQQAMDTGWLGYIPIFGSFYTAYRLHEVKNQAYEVLPKTIADIYTGEYLDMPIARYASIGVAEIALTIASFGVGSAVADASSTALRSVISNNLARAIASDVIAGTASNIVYTTGMHLIESSFTRRFDTEKYLKDLALGEIIVIPFALAGGFIRYSAEAYAEAKYANLDLQFYEALKSSTFKVNKAEVYARSGSFDINVHDNIYIDKAKALAEANRLKLADENALTGSGVVGARYEVANTFSFNIREPEANSLFEKIVYAIGKRVLGENNPTKAYVYIEGDVVDITYKLANRMKELTSKMNKGLTEEFGENAPKYSIVKGKALGYGEAEFTGSVNIVLENAKGEIIETSISEPVYSFKPYLREVKYVEQRSEYPITDEKTLIYRSLDKKSKNVFPFYEFEIFDVDKDTRIAIGLAKSEETSTKVAMGIASVRSKDIEEFINIRASGRGATNYNIREGEGIAVYSDFDNNIKELFSNLDNEWKFELLKQANLRDYKNANLKSEESISNDFPKFKDSGERTPRGGGATNYDESISNNFSKFKDSGERKPGGEPGGENANKGLKVLTENKDLQVLSKLQDTNIVRNVIKDVEIKAPARSIESLKVKPALDTNTDIKNMFEPIQSNLDLGVNKNIENTQEAKLNVKQINIKAFDIGRGSISIQESKALDPVKYAGEELNKLFDLTNIAKGMNFDEINIKINKLNLSDKFAFKNVQTTQTIQTPSTKELKADLDLAFVSFNLDFVSFDFDTDKHGKVKIKIPATLDSNKKDIFRFEDEGRGKVKTAKKVYKIADPFKLI